MLDPFECSTELKGQYQSLFVAKKMDIPMFCAVGKHSLFGGFTISLEYANVTQSGRNNDIFPRVQSHGYLLEYFTSLFIIFDI